MATPDRVTEFTLEAPAPLGGEEPEGAAPGVGPWRLGLRRLKRNRTALAFGGLFLVLVAICLLAPVWANQVAETTPRAGHLTDVIQVDGRPTNVVSPQGVPIGPTWSGKFFLGADANGRDVMVRLLYGGRNSLEIGIGASLITALCSVLFGLLAGYYRGWVDGAVSRVMDIIWAFPVVILGVALGTALAISGLNVGPIHLESGNKFIPMLIIAVVYVPYMARPIRGEVLSLREKEFVEAARAQGASSARIMGSELLPNLASTIIVFLPLMVANAILLEAALSFLGAGVQPPETSWGTMISDGVDRIVTAPHLAIAPGAMLVATVLALNVFGDGVRDALDPRAKVRIER